MTSLNGRQQNDAAMNDIFATLMYTMAKAFQSANKTRSAENSLGNDATLEPQDDAKIAADTFGHRYKLIGLSKLIIDFNINHRFL